MERFIGLTLLLLLLSVLIFAPPAWAAVTFDSTFEKASSNAASPSNFSFVSNAGTVAGTVTANTNRQLYCTFISNDTKAGNGAVTLTWDDGGTNQAMTEIVSLDLPSSSTSVYLFGLIAPTAGNLTIKAAWAGSGHTGGTTYLGCVSVYNADQGVGWRNGGSDSGTGTTGSSTIASDNGNMVIVAHDNNNGNGASLAISPGTQAWKDTSRDTNSAMGYLASVSTSSVVTATWTTSVDWANVKVDAIQFTSYTRPRASAIVY